MGDIVAGKKRRGVVSLLWGLLPLAVCRHRPIKVPVVGACPVTLNHDVRLLNQDKNVNLCQEYKGKVLLIVNTASKCGFTSQYADLETLYAQYKDQGFVVLGFPSNDFAQQEPGDEKQVQDFCRLTYDVQFPMFAKAHVKKHNADPLYLTLGSLSGTYPKWNFYKYLLDRKGNIVNVSWSLTNPKKLHKTIERLLTQTD